MLHENPVDMILARSVERWAANRYRLECIGTSPERIRKLELESILLARSSDRSALDHFRCAVKHEMRGDRRRRVEFFPGEDRSITRKEYKSERKFNRLVSWLLDDGRAF